MESKNGVLVRYLRSDETHDIYIVLGVMEEPDEPKYHKELRNTGSDEKYVLALYTD
jgi:hypothetical protein